MILNNFISGEIIRKDNFYDNSVLVVVAEDVIGGVPWYKALILDKKTRYASTFEFLFLAMIKTELQSRGLLAKDFY